MRACRAPRLDDLKGGDPAHNAEAIRAVLAGRPGPLRDAVGAGLPPVPWSWPGGRRTCARVPGSRRQSIDSGAAQAALEQLVRITNTPAAA